MLKMVFFVFLSFDFHRSEIIWNCVSVNMNAHFWFFQEPSLKKQLRTTKKKQKKKSVKANKDEKDEAAQEQEEEEEGEGNEGEQENAVHRNKASSALIPPKKSKLKCQTQVEEETQDVVEALENDETMLKGWIVLLLTGCFNS